MSQHTSLENKPFYPWLVWSLVSLFFFYKYLLQFSPSVMTSSLMAAFSVQGTGLGNMAACFYYPYLLMQFPVGILLDKYSPKKITAAAVFLCALGAYLFNIFSSFGVNDVPARALAIEAIRLDIFLLNPRVAGSPLKIYPKVPPAFASSNLD